MIAIPQTVILHTQHGDIVLTLNGQQSPITVKNFLHYVKKGFYHGTIFHRVIDNFMIQGGGLDINMKSKKSRVGIRNEANNGLKNKRGSIAMARTSLPHSATSQFFINVVDNPFLDYDADTGEWGYCVFGIVTEGMDVVDKIKEVATTQRHGYDDVPVDPIMIDRTSYRI